MGWIQNGYKFMYKNGKDIAEHRVIWESKYGKIPKGYNIHHKNGNKIDNKIQNLELLHIGKHNKKHNRGFKKGNQFYKNRKITRGNTLRDIKTGRFIKNEK